jgi:acyl-CoA thioester hydrolase
LTEAETKAAPTPFVYRTQIFFDDLDPTQRLHNTRYAVFMEHATQAFYRSAAQKWVLDYEGKPDQYQVVRELHLVFHAAFRGVADLLVEMRVAKMGRSNCVYTFRFVDDEGTKVYAEGRRSVVKIDPTTGHPLAWSDRFREIHEPLRMPEEAPKTPKAQP